MPRVRPLPLGDAGPDDLRPAEAPPAAAPPSAPGHAVALRQEQAPATREPVEVAPGVVRLQLPIALPGLGHVNTYLIEDHRGAALVDTGLPGVRAWQLLLAALGRAGVAARRIHTVVLTHAHPDHVGAAGWLRRLSGCEVLAHRRFRIWWDGLLHAPPWEAAGMRPADAVRAGARLLARPAAWVAGEPSPTRRLDDGDVVRLGGRDWVAVHTPGHSPDHLCLFDPDGGSLLAGDHVLPTISPHLSGLSGAVDPLGDYLASLGLVAALPGVATVLPAHGQPFDDLPGRARKLVAHHGERLGRLQAGGPDGPAPVAVHAEVLFGPRLARSSLAISETYVHLEHLRLRGLATRGRNGGDLVYTVSDPERLGPEPNPPS